MKLVKPVTCASNATFGISGRGRNRGLTTGFAIGLIAVLVSCTVGDSEPEQPEQPETGAIAARDRQGTRVQGGSLDTWFGYLPGTIPSEIDPLAPDGFAFDTVTIRYGSISARRGAITYADADMVGSVFWGKNLRTGTTLKLRVDAVQLRTTTTTGLNEFQYSIKFTDSMGAETPLCGHADNVAIPAPGNWDQYGGYDGVSSRFTFLCLTGVAEKCVRWGYRYWEPQYAAYHQACTRMARADYCGNGQSHTVDGTLIDLYDRRGVEGDPAFINQAPAATPTLSFEAAWPAKSGALCLSKLRWSTLPLGGYCPNLLPDPRVDLQNPRAKYCEDIVGTPRDRINVLSDAGAVVFNDSAYVDAGLYRWTNPVTGQQWTTSRGFYDPSGRTTVAPGAGFARASFVGAVFRVGVEPALLPAGAVRLRTWRQTGSGKLITTTAHPNRIVPGSVYTAHNTEGWIISASAGGSPPVGARSLNLYRNSDGNFATATESPGASFRLIRMEGYLLR